MSITNFHEKHPGLHLILSVVKRVIMRDEQFIKDHESIYSNPNILHLENRGKNNYGKIVYSIHENGEGYGFFAELRLLLEKLLYVDYMGFKPSVIYGQNYLYYDEEMNNKIPNAFEYYFEKIGGYADTEESYNVIKEKRYYINCINHLYNNDFYKTYDDAMICMIKKYIHMRKELINDITDQYISLFPKGKVMGIHYRGTDYNIGYNNHPRKIELNQIYKFIDNYREHYEYIFLATDEEGIYELLKNRYGEKVKCYSDVKRNKGQISVAFSIDDRSNHHYLLGFEVLRDMYSLSMCDGIICGQSQVTNFARWQKRAREEKYDIEIVIDNGMNHNGVDFGKAIENRFVKK